MLKKNQTKDGFAQSIEFDTSEGAKELYVFLRAPENISLEQSLHLIWDNYKNILQVYELQSVQPVYTRVFLSDVENQHSIVADSDIYKKLSVGSIRLVGNEPLDSGKISIVSYHLIGSNFSVSRPECQSGDAIVVKGSSYNLSFIADLGCSCENNPKNQTDYLLEKLKTSIPDVNISKDLVRTWVSVRDIDNNYMPFVESRRNYFSTWGMDSFFPASTGVEGRSADTSRLVMLDAMCVSGLDEFQISKMEALDNMPSTLTYGVTFERGLKLCFGDRAQYLLSGTASIDKDGQVKHLGDIRNQVICAFDNLKALLVNNNISWENLAYLIFYIRDAKDIGVVRAVTESIIPSDIPRLYIRSSICRPQWLMEIDGVAYSEGDSRFQPFV